MARASEKVQYSAEVGVAIDEIDRHLRPASQMRVQLDLVAVAEYAENLDQLPAVKVMHDPAIGKHWVVDGAHTITAYGRCGEQEVRAVVATGSYDDAYREASRCNGKRGVRLYDVDYRHRILQYAEELRRAKRKMTQQEIADICDVSQQYVSRILASMSPNTGFTTSGKSPNTSASKPGRGRPRKPRGDGDGRGVPDPGETPPVSVPGGAVLPAREAPAPKGAPPVPVTARLRASKGKEGPGAVRCCSGQQQVTIKILPPQELPAHLARKSLLEIKFTLEEARTFRADLDRAIGSA
jgi:hypothetical protein